MLNSLVPRLHAGSKSRQNLKDFAAHGSRQVPKFYCLVELPWTLLLVYFKRNACIAVEMCMAIV